MNSEDYKMKLKKMLAGHLFVLALVFSSTVSAEDFTFNIPVEISNLHPDVNQMRVLCEIEGMTNGDGDGEPTLINVPATGGAVNTTVQVKINAPNGMPALSPEAMPMRRGYFCKLQVSKSGTGFQDFLPSNSGQCNVANNWRCARTGAPFTGSVQGVMDVYTE
jgi:hypothetical protein